MCWTDPDSRNVRQKRPHATFTKKSLNEYKSPMIYANDTASKTSACPSKLLRNSQSFAHLAVLSTIRPPVTKKSSLSPNRR